MAVESAEDLIEELWDVLGEVDLQPEVEDSHIWRFSTSGQVSSRGHVHWCCFIQTMEKDLEDLGFRKVSIFHVACCTYQMLDCWPSSMAWPTTPT
jgi:hypothetical protein